jgi:hypothetical protein
LAESSGRCLNFIEKKGEKLILPQDYVVQNYTMLILQTIYFIQHLKLVMSKNKYLLFLSATRGKEKPIQGEFTCRHPENENAELLWHCGPFPLKYKAKGVKPYLYNTKPSFRLEDGQYTIARFQADKGKYYLFAKDFNTCDGPNTFGTYMWAEFEDWEKLEKKIVDGPYIHHMTEIPGNYVEYFKEFTKYFDDIEFDTI